jgi:hypothetical protein
MLHAQLWQDIFPQGIFTSSPRNHVQASPWRCQRLAVRVFHSTMFAFYSHVVKLNAVNKPWWNNYLSSRSCGRVLSFKHMRRWGVTNPFTWSDTAQFTGTVHSENVKYVACCMHNCDRIFSRREYLLVHLETTHKLPREDAKDLSHRVNLEYVE